MAILTILKKVLPKSHCPPPSPAESGYLLLEAANEYSVYQLSLRLFSS